MQRYHVDCRASAGDLLQHSATLGRLRKGRYGGEPVLDYLENKATKAVYITAQHIVYVNLGRQSVRWALSLCHLFSVTTAGASQLLCARSTWLLACA